jgi:hypothetical protein
VLRVAVHWVLQVARVQLATHVSLVVLQVPAQVLAVPMHVAPQPASEEASGAAVASDALVASVLVASTLVASVLVVSALVASVATVVASTEPAL